ncbi:MAG TPA: hypothetical protein VGF80_12910 [Galbitalea sp.]|jgi:hypothetical protein
MSNDDNKYRETAEADVASVEVGDTPSDVESKVIGLTHISGQPSHNAAEGEKSADTVEGS